MLKSSDLVRESSLRATVDRFIVEVAEVARMAETARIREGLDVPGEPLPDVVSSPGESLNPSAPLSSRALASLIDHTFLKPEATPDDARRICAEARRHAFAAVCVNSGWIGLVNELLDGCATLPITVVGFPLGACSTASKVFETRQAIRDGAREIDMVIAWGALKGKDYLRVHGEIAEVVEAARPFGVKAILETAALSLEEKIIACALARAAGVAFVKTSTGFGPGGATVEDVALLRRIVGPTIGVKASGGIRSYDSALQMIRAGANRIGSSEGVRFIEQAAAGTPSVDCQTKL